MLTPMASVRPVKRMALPVSLKAVYIASSKYSPARSADWSRAKQVDAVIDANADAKRHHGRGRGFQADLEVNHERVGEVAHDGQRQHDAERGAPRAER